MIKNIDRLDGHVFQIKMASFMEIVEGYFLILIL